MEGGKPLLRVTVVVVLAVVSREPAGADQQQEGRYVSPQPRPTMWGYPCVWL
jgi:hypothetical protein